MTSVLLPCKSSCKKARMRDPHPRTAPYVASKEAMSDQALSLFTCADKIAYRSEGKARHAAGHARKRTRQWVSPYACPICYEWHIGPAPKRVQSGPDAGVDNLLRVLVGNPPR